MSKEAYQEYLKTDVWKELRRQRLALDRDECALCEEKAAHVHHKRYPKKWGTETMVDLVSLCSECHGKFHGAHDDRSVANCILGMFARFITAPTYYELCGYIDGRLEQESVDDLLKNDSLYRALYLYSESSMAMAEAAEMLR